MNISQYDVLQYPHITEKSTLLSESGKYVFTVTKTATKSDVAKAVEKFFSVKVEKVNVLNMPGKIKRFKGRMGKRSDFKKAIVTLAKDNVIDFTGGVK